MKGGIPRYFSCDYLADSGDEDPIEEIWVYQTWKTLDYAVGLTKAWRLFLHRPPTHFTYIFELKFLFDMSRGAHVYHSVWVLTQLIILKIVILNILYTFNTNTIGNIYYKLGMHVLGWKLSIWLIYYHNTLCPCAMSIPDEGIYVLYNGKNHKFYIRYTNVSHYF